MQRSWWAALVLAGSLGNAATPLVDAAPVTGRLVVELTGDGADDLRRGALTLPFPEGAEALTPRVDPLFPGSSGPLARFALLAFRVDRAAGRPGLPTGNAPWIEALRRSPTVRAVQPDEVFAVAALPDDPYFRGEETSSRQFHLHNPGFLSLESVRAWPFVPAGREVTVAIVDTGVDWRHPDLGGPNPPVGGVLAVNPDEQEGTPDVDDDGNGYVDDVIGWDFVDLTGITDLPPGATPAPGEDATQPDADPSDLAGHGTEVAGLVHAITGNGQGIAGAAPPARILPIRVGWRGADGGSYVLMSFCAQGLVYAAQSGARVGNCSWNSANLDNLGAAIDNAVGAHDMVIVGSAGNNGTSSTTVQYLASRVDCIGVAGLDADGTKATASNYGPWVDVAAFYKGMATTTFDYGTLSSSIGANFIGGTSFSAPQVTALAVLLRAVDPTASASLVRATVSATARDLSDLEPQYAAGLGGGLANYAKAVQSLGGGWDAVRPATGLLPFGSILACFGEGTVEMVDVDSGGSVPGWESGVPLPLPPPVGSLPVAITSGLLVSPEWVVWVSGDSLYSRDRIGGTPPGFPVPLPAGAGSPVATRADAPGVARVLVPVDSGIFEVVMSPTGVDTASLDIAVRAPAAAVLESTSWIAGLDTQGRLRIRRESVGSVADTTLDLGSAALPPLLGEFDGPGMVLAVGAASDSLDPQGLQHVVFADPDIGIRLDVPIAGPPVVHLALAGFPGQGRLVAVTSDEGGTVRLVGIDGFVETVEAGGELAGEPLCADLDGDSRTDLLVLRADGVLSAYDDGLAQLPGFPREFPFGFREAPAIVDGLEGRMVAAADTSGNLWVLPLGPTGAPAPWPTARGGGDRSGYLGFHRGTPVNLLRAALSWKESPSGFSLCWRGQGFEEISELRIRGAAGATVIWEGPAQDSGCAPLRDVSGGVRLLLEGRHHRRGWMVLGAIEAPAQPGIVAATVRPNPFRAESRIRWTGGRGVISLDVLDVRGARVWWDTVLASRGEAVWTGRDHRGVRVPAGVYFLRMRGQGLAVTQRLIKLP